MVGERVTTTLSYLNREPRYTHFSKGVHDWRCVRPIIDRLSWKLVDSTVAVLRMQRALVTMKLKFSNFLADLADERRTRDYYPQAFLIEMYR